MYCLFCFKPDSNSNSWWVPNCIDRSRIDIEDGERWTWINSQKIDKTKKPVRYSQLELCLSSNCILTIHLLWLSLFDTRPAKSCTYLVYPQLITNPFSLLRPDQCTISLAKTIHKATIDDNQERGHRKAHLWALATVLVMVVGLGPQGHMIQNGSNQHTTNLLPACMDHRRIFLGGRILIPMLFRGVIDATLHMSLNMGFTSPV